MSTEVSSLAVPASPLSHEHFEAVFQWRDAFSVANAEMDSTHREFVACVDRLLKVPDADIEMALRDFHAHALRHFAEEDESMRSSGYEAAGCHVEEHAAVLQSTVVVLAAMAQGDRAVVRAFARALADWFPEHARVMDDGLARFLDGRRLGGAPLLFRPVATQRATRQADLQERA